MAHNLEMYAGKASMVYNSQYGSPWHELGTPVDGAMTAAQAMELSRQDWDVIKRQLLTENAAGSVVAVPAFGMFRDDNGAFLGTCGADYEPIQNVKQFESIDFLLETSTGAHYDTAGVLGRGERVWALARIPAADITVGADDRHESYLLACTSHDGSLAFTLKLTSTRVVCQNTMSMALSANGALARIKHTRNALDRVEQAKRYMRLVSENSATLADKLNTLASRKMTPDTYRSIMDKLFPITKNADGDPTSQGRRDNILSDVIRLYESNDRNAFPEHKGTAYNLLNAVTEWTDHLRTARLSDDKKDLGYSNTRARYEAAIFGSGDTLKNKALEVILEDTAGNPIHQVQTFTAPRPTMPTPPSSGSLLDSILSAQA